MPPRLAWFVACVLLCGGAYAEDSATSASVAHQPGRHTRANHNPRSSRTNNDSAPVHSQNRNEARYPDFSIPESLNATDLMEIQKLSEAGNAAPSGGPGSGRTAFSCKESTTRRSNCSPLILFCASSYPLRECICTWRSEQHCPRQMTNHGAMASDTVRVSRGGRSRFGGRGG